MIHMVYNVDRDTSCLQCRSCVDHDAYGNLSAATPASKHGARMALQDRARARRAPLT